MPQGANVSSLLLNLKLFSLLFSGELATKSSKNPRNRQENESSYFRINVFTTLLRIPAVYMQVH